MYVVGIVIALYVVLPYIQARGIKRDTALELFFPIVIGGLVGGRLYYVVQSNFGYYLSHPWKIVATWEGGMAFFGAILGASMAIAYVTWRRKLPVWIVLDAGAVFAPLGQAFGRVGNVINGDIVGSQSNCAWCTRYINVNSFAPSHNLAYQPAAAYELLISLFIFGVIFALRFRLPRAGMVFALYLVLYAISQFGIFFVRSEPLTSLGLRQAQLTAIVVFSAGLALFGYLARKGPTVAVPPSPERSDPSSALNQAETG